MNTSVKALIERMKTYDGRFDGYPSMTCFDLGLVEEAMQAKLNDCSDVVFLCFLASEHTTSKEEYKNAKAFILDYAENIWDCNMSEGDNPVHGELEDEDEPYDHIKSGVL